MHKLTLVCYLTVALTSVATTVSDAFLAHDQKPSTRLSAAVAQDLAAGRQRIPVIVHLTVPAAALVPLQRDDSRADAVRVTAVATTVRSHLRALSATLREPDLRVIRTLTLQPAFAAVTSPRGLSVLLSSPEVRFVESDVRWRVHTAEGLALIHASDVHQLGLTGAGSAIAVIDTGVDPMQPALGGRAFPNSKIVHGLDTGDGDDDPTDCGTHGTAVAAIAVGSSYQWNPQLRFAGGVAPQAKLLAYKAASDAECDVLTLSAVIAAMEDAVVHRTGEDYTLAAINISGGAGMFSGLCDGEFSAYASAVTDATQAGIPVVASSGNQGELDAIASPACLSQVIGVGSVWDVDTEWMNVGFCLDPECSTVCEDSYVPAGTVTCYTNIAPTLDVLAPSEFLTTVRAGGQTMEFGGTSGAAAYVSGSLAVLREALPSADPATARLRLQMSGRPVLDRRSGLVRPMVDLACAVESNSRFAVAAPGAALTAADGQPVTSTVWIGDSGPIGSLRVLLHLAHQHPEHLSVKLSSPDGLTIRLHDRTPGTLLSNLPAMGGLWGSYPDEIAPIESLGVFCGHEMTGRWTLEVDDVGRPDGGTGILVDWAIEIIPLTDPSLDSPSARTIPVVAHLSGVDDAVWTSDLRLYNPSPARVADVTLRFFGSSADAPVSHRQSNLRVHPRTLIHIPDLVSRLFGVTGARGSLRIASSSRLIATSRTSTTDARGGLFGQYVGTESEPAVAALDLPPVYLGHLGDDESYRTNIGFSEISGQPLVVSVTVYDGDSGAGVGTSKLYTVEPFSNVQTRLNVGHPHGNLYAVVSAVEGAGRVLAYASRVDNRTQDASFSPGRRPEASAEFMVPVVARTDGRGGTVWRTELRIANLDTSPASIELQLRPRLGEAGSATAREYVIHPGHVLATDDAIRSLFGIDHTVASLRIVSSSGSGRLLISSRTYNLEAAGTYGQRVPAVSSGTATSATLIHHNGGGPSRTNLGLCEVAGGDLMVQCRLFDRAGRRLGEPLLVELAPYRLTQLNGVFEQMGVPDASVAWVQFDAIAGDGAFVGYASVVDAITGDAIYVPARATTDSSPKGTEITRGRGQTPP